MTDTLELKPQDIVADIAKHAADSVPTDELTERMLTFCNLFHDDIAQLRLTLLGVTALAIERTMEKGGDMEIAHRIMAQELEYAAAVTVRSMYRKLGEPMHPARFAMVAYVNAVASAQMWERDHDNGQLVADQLRERRQ